MDTTDRLFLMQMSIQGSVALGLLRDGCPPDGEISPESYDAVRLLLNQMSQLGDLARVWCLTEPPEDLRADSEMPGIRAHVSRGESGDAVNQLDIDSADGDSILGLVGEDVIVLTVKQWKDVRDMLQHLRAEAAGMDCP